MKEKEESEIRCSKEQEMRPQWVQGWGDGCGRHQRG